MAYKRVLTIQDISCVGQCSLTVALPILSACGHETAILPSAVLSTHTAGFKGFTFRDLTSEMEPIREHWVKEGIMFDAVTTGYLGSREQIAIVKRIIQTCTKSGAPAIIDPAMADNGKLYPAFNADYVEAMKTLVALADFLLPNISEAAFLTGKEYRETYDEAYVADLAEALHDLGAKTVVLTGIGYRPGKTGVAVSSPGTDMYYYEHRKIAQGCHGTGDVYASAPIWQESTSMKRPKLLPTLPLRVSRPRKRKRTTGTALSSSRCSENWPPVLCRINQRQDIR